MQSPSWAANCVKLVKKFPAFHRTRRFITALTSVRHLSLSWTSPNQSINPHPTSWRSVLILSTHLRLGLPSGLFPSGFPTETLYTPLSSPIRATCPAHLLTKYYLIRKSIKFKVAIKEIYLRKPWEMVADRKGPTDHTLGATDLVELIEVVFFFSRPVRQCKCSATPRLSGSNTNKTVNNVSRKVSAIQHKGDKLYRQTYLCFISIVHFNHVWPFYGVYVQCF